MQSFDPDTGQMYVETAFAPVTSMISTFLSNHNGKKEDPSTYRNIGPGCSSLYETALRSCVWNINYPGMAESLPYYDWHHGERIYRKLKETDTLSAKAWSALRIAYPDHMKNNYHLRITEKRGASPSKLNTLSKQMASLPPNTLTMLCIRSLPISAPALCTDLLQFTNLAVLVLEQHCPELSHYNHIPDQDDRLIRSWGLAVNESGAFKQLKVVMLKHFDISANALIGLTVFPALLLCNLESWCIHMDLKDAEKTGMAYKHRNKGGELKWAQILKTGLSQDRQNEFPETTWSRPDLIASRKMEILYDYASKLFTENPDGREEYTALSIDYGDHRTVQYRRSLSAWFVRALEVDQQKDEDVPKRKQEVVVGRASPASIKKRKVRNGKDIGSMLGSFG